MKSIHIYIFIDALGHELVKRYNFMPNELPFKSKLTSTFGYSSTCIPSILTGLKPNEHGHFSSFFKSENSPFKKLWPLKFIPSFIQSKSRFRGIVSKLVGKAFGYTGYFSLYHIPYDEVVKFDYIEKKDIYKEDGIVNNKDTIFDLLNNFDREYSCSDWRESDEHNLEEALSKVEDKNLDVLYVYCSELDALLHQEGNTSVKVENKIKWYESYIRKIIEKSEKEGRTTTVSVFSDHGMSDVKHQHNLMKSVADLGLSSSTDYTAVYDSTMIRFWFNNNNSYKIILEYLNTLDFGRVLSENELKDWSCYFEDGKFGEVIFLLEPGHIVCPSFMGVNPVKGMHGYSPIDKDSYATFCSNKDMKIPMNSITDIYSLIEKEVCV